MMRTSTFASVLILGFASLASAQDYVDDPTSSVYHPDRSDAEWTRIMSVWPLANPAGL